MSPPQPYAIHCQVFAPEEDNTLLTGLLCAFEAVPEKQSVGALQYQACCLLQHHRDGPRGLLSYIDEDMAVRKATAQAASLPQKTGTVALLAYATESGCMKAWPRQM